MLGHTKSTLFKISSGQRSLQRAAAGLRNWNTSVTTGQQLFNRHITTNTNNMSTNHYLDYQRDHMASIKFDRLALPLELTINDLPTQLFATVLSHALSDRRNGFLPSILNTAKMFKKTSTARPAPTYLLVNKRFSRIGKQVWLQTDFSHIYINSWAPLHRGLIASASKMSFVSLSLDIRRGERALNEKLVPSALGAKLRELLHEMKNLEVLMVRVWHGIGSLAPVSEIIMNNFSGVRVKQAVNIASILCLEGGVDQDRGCPGLLSDYYIKNFMSHLLHLPMKRIPKPTTAYLDESEPLLKIPIWRGCAATRKSAEGAWMPVMIEKQPEEEQEVRSAEEDEALTQLVKERVRITKSDDMNGTEDTGMADAGGESDSSSIVSVVTPPANVLRAYTAIDPPQLPHFTFVNGQSHVTDWHKHSWRYTARKDAHGAGFEVRQLDIDKFGGYEVPDWNNLFYWPPEYNLGPPTHDADWHGLIAKWGLPVLEKAGFLNHYPLDDDDYAEPIGRLARARNSHQDDNMRIHPVLRQDMWPGIDDDDYQLLEPALLLASALLDDPGTLAFFHAISDLKSMTELEDEVHGKCKVASVPATLSNAQETEIYRKILAMRNWLEWKFAPAPEMVKANALALTDWRDDKNGNRLKASNEHCSQSTIYVCQTFLDVLKRYDDDFSTQTNNHKAALEAWLDIARVPQSRRPKQIDPISAYERTNFQLADTIVHEFCHAFNGAHFPDRGDGAPTEPWIKGNRSNELGHALIVHLIGGDPSAMLRFSNSRLEEFEQGCSIPFGFWFAKRWDLWRDKAGAEKTTTADKDQVLNTAQVFYPVPQKYVHNMTTKETWIHQVPRYGLAALRLPRLEEWAIMQRRAIERQESLLVLVVSIEGFEKHIRQFGHLSTNNDFQKHLIQLLASPQQFVLVFIHSTTSRADGRKHISLLLINNLWAKEEEATLQSAQPLIRAANVEDLPEWQKAIINEVLGRILSPKRARTVPSENVIVQKVRAIRQRTTVVICQPECPPPSSFDNDTYPPLPQSTEPTNITTTSKRITPGV
ncbi:hypothetical protein KCV04_g52, partial [Aureobasidium melanogenum]